MWSSSHWQHWSKWYLHCNQQLWNPFQLCRGQYDDKIYSNSEKKHVNKFQKTGILKKMLLAEKINF